jgi:hypothetical protein
MSERRPVSIERATEIELNLLDGGEANRDDVRDLCAEVRALSLLSDHLIRERDDARAALASDSYAVAYNAHANQLAFASVALRKSCPNQSVDLSLADGILTLAAERDKLRLERDRLDENGKIKKPEGWKPPDIRRLLLDQGWSGKDGTT